MVRDVVCVRSGGLGIIDLDLSHLAPSPIDKCLQACILMLLSGRLDAGKSVRNFWPDSSSLVAQVDRTLSHGNSGVVHGGRYSDSHGFHELWSPVVRLTGFTS